MSNSRKKWWAFICMVWVVVMILWIANSCSIQNKVHRHVTAAEKHINKAVSLDPSIKINEADTITVNTVSTKTDTLYTDSLIYVNTTVTITDTIYVPTPVYDFSEVKTNSQVRQEERTARKTVKETEHTKRVVVRQENRSDRTATRWSSIGVWMLLLGIVIGVMGYWAIRRYLVPVIRRRRETEPIEPTEPTEPIENN